MSNNKQTSTKVDSNNYKKQMSTSWDIDKYDDFDLAQNSTIDSLSKRVSLSRNNKHSWDYDNLLHTQTTTLRSGLIGSLAAHNLFSNGTKGFRVSKISALNFHDLSFTEDLISSFSAFDVYTALLYIEQHHPVEYKSKKIGDVAEYLTDKLFQNLEVFNAHTSCIYTEIKRVAKKHVDIQDYKPTPIPYDLLLIEAFNRILEISELSIELPKNEIEVIQSYLLDISNHTFRDANPLNVRVPFKNEFSHKMEDNFEQKTFLNLKELLMTGDINRIISSLDMDNMINVDLEMIGIKATSFYDDYHHIIGLQSSEHVANYALNNYKN